MTHLGDAVEHDRVGAGLLNALALVPDPRKSRGLRHQITGVLALAACAVLAGARSFTAIGEWAADAPDEVKAMLGIATTVPCESTIRRALQRLNCDALDTAIDAWAAGHTEPSGAGRRLSGPVRRR